MSNHSTHFPCDVCSCPVKPMTGKNRTIPISYIGFGGSIDFLLPDDLEVITCESCGETYHNEKSFQEIENLYQISLKQKQNGE
jgi:hypothetical protein